MQSLHIPRWHITILLAVAGASLPLYAQEVLPSPAVNTAPSPAPAWPAGFDAVPPIGSGSPAANTPLVAEYTRTGAPGDTLVLSGTRFTSQTDTAQGRDTRVSVTGANGVQAEADILRLEGELMAITLPSSLPPWSTYALWVHNTAGAGRPVLINRTEAWWAGPEMVTQGSTFAVHGRNLARGNGASQGWLYVQPTAGGAGQWLVGSAVDPCRIQATLPSGLATGSYRVWAHNGHGGTYGWSAPLIITVVAPRVWNSNVLDVTAYGAVANDAGDDSAAFEAACADAQANLWSTIQVPAGTFRISRQLTIPWNTRLRGAGMDATTITNTTTYFQPAYPLLRTGGEGEFRDLTILGGPESAAAYSSVGEFRGVWNQLFINVRFSNLGWGTTPGGSVDIHTAEQLRFQGCEFISSEASFFGQATQVQVENCRFLAHHDANTLVNIWGGRKLSFTGCVAKDFAPGTATGQGKGRFLAGIGSWGTTSDLYYGNNQTIDFAPRADPGVDQNSGEQFMWEGLHSVWRGPVSSADAQSVVCTTLSEDVFGGRLVATVVAGTGVGQTRLVSGYDAATQRMTVEEPWLVRPDTSSSITLSNQLRRVGIYGSTFDGKAEVANGSEQVASAGVQPYGSSSDIIAIHNQFSDLRNGISNWSLMENDAPMAPNLFHLYADNTFTGCLTAVRMICFGATPIEERAITGTVFRNNRIIGNLAEAFATQNPDGPTDRVSFTVYDRNTVEDATVGIEVSEQRNAIVVGNTLARGTAASADSSGLIASAGSPPVLRNNNWSGEASSVRTLGGAQAAGLAVPQRVLTAGQALRLWNTGTAPLAWTATSNVPWLVLGTAAGTVQDQRSTTNVSLGIDATRIPVGSQQAVVTISTSVGSQQILVRAVGAAVNQAPVINALTLSGTATAGTSVVAVVSAQDPDAGPQPLTYAWSAQGPGSVLFSAPAATSTNLTCATPGSYVVTCQVNDGQLSASRSATLVVAAASPTWAPGLKGEFFALATMPTSLPNFDGLVPVSVRRVSVVDLGHSWNPWPGLLQKHRDQLGMRHSGHLRVDVGGRYTMAVTSDAGARLWIGGVLVVDDAMAHTARTTSRAIDLVPGYYALRLDAFEDATAAVLRLAWRQPGATATTTIPADRLWHQVSANDTSPVIHALEVGWASATSVFLRALVSDTDLGPQALTATWNMVSGPAAMTLSTNDVQCDASGLTTLARLTQPGRYVARVVVGDGKYSVSATVAFTNGRQVRQLIVQGPATMSVGSQALFSAQSFDQYGLPALPLVNGLSVWVPALQWSASGPGSIQTTSGVLQATGAGTIQLRVVPTGLVQPIGTATVQIAPSSSN